MVLGVVTARLQPVVRQGDEEYFPQLPYHLDQGGPQAGHLLYRSLVGMELLERKTKELEDRLQVAESKISQLVTDKSCKMSDVVEDKKENKAGGRLTWGQLGEDTCAGRAGPCYSNVLHH